jgi:hypothetical protein
MHIKIIFQRLREIELQVNIEKCKFNVIKIFYLNIIVITKSICINFKKINAIIK